MTVTMETRTEVTEVTSLAQTQEMIMSIFSCVAYLRDLFPEESFQQHRVAGMNLKKFRRCTDASTLRFLDWIEQGCYDALCKKYLKSAILTVLADTTNPNNVLETYTLRVSYPDSATHQTIDNSLAKLSLTRNEQAVLKVDAAASSFKDAMAKILRTLCVMTQTLDQLPARKFLSLKLTYYEEVTPAGYEPPGFVAADFDLDHLFAGPTSKFNFGKATTPFHGLALQMETICDGEGIRNSKDSSLVSEKQSSSQSVAQPNNFAESLAVASQVPIASASPVEFPASQPIIAPKAKEKTAPASEEESGRSDSDSDASVRCSCGANECDSDMILCDACNMWQHTVCAGFVSMRDKRLNENRAYKCFSCRFAGKPKTLAFLARLSLFRRAVSVSMERTYASGPLLAKRLGVSSQVLQPVLAALISEGFLQRAKYSKLFRPPLSDAMKERLKVYFHQDLELHPEFVAARDEEARIGGATSASQFMSQQPQIVKNAKTVPSSNASFVMNSGLPASPVTPAAVMKRKASADASTGGHKLSKMSVPSQRIACYSQDPQA